MPLGFDEVVSRNYGVLRSNFRQCELIASILSNKRNEVAGAEPNDPAIQHGICLAISAEWIEHNSRGSNFWNWIGTPTGRGDLVLMGHRETGLVEVGKTLEIARVIKSAYAVDEKQLEKLRKQKGSWATTWIEDKKVLKSAPRVNGSLRDSGYGLALEIVSTEGFKLIAIESTSTKKGHALAASVSGNKVIYLDPNGGEAEFDKSDFRSWFQMEHILFYIAAGYDTYYVDAFPVPVNVTVVQESFGRPRSDAITSRPPDVASSSPVAATPGQRGPRPRAGVFDAATVAPPPEGVAAPPTAEMAATSPIPAGPVAIRRPRPRAGVFPTGQ